MFQMLKHFNYLLAALKATKLSTIRTRQVTEGHLMNLIDCKTRLMFSVIMNHVSHEALCQQTWGYEAAVSSFSLCWFGWRSASMLNKRGSDTLTPPASGSTSLSDSFSQASSRLNPCRTSAFSGSHQQLISASGSDQLRGLSEETSLRC